MLISSPIPDEITSGEVAHELAGACLRHAWTVMFMQSVADLTESGFFPGQRRHSLGPLGGSGWNGPSNSEKRRAFKKVIEI